MKVTKAKALNTSDLVYLQWLQEGATAKGAVALPGRLPSATGVPR